MNCRVVALGFFDGVHLGHQAILSGADGAITFRNHPLGVLAPADAPHLIMSLDDRLAAIRACGVREVSVLDFTPALAAMRPEDFAARYLADGETRPAVRCGANWRFGAGGVGDAKWLRAHGFAATVVPFEDFAGAPISSSRIRATLEAGDLTSANAMLGRPFRVAGDVERGKALGRRLGFPTVNLRPAALEVRLPLGVYEVVVDGLRGLANYGVAPTLEGRRWETPTLEIHFPGCGDADLPSANRLAVDVLRFVRRERKFDSLDALREQIAHDLAGFGSR